MKLFKMPAIKLEFDRVHVNLIQTVPTSKLLLYQLKVDDNGSKTLIPN